MLLQPVPVLTSSYGQNQVTILLNAICLLLLSGKGISADKKQIVNDMNDSQIIQTDRQTAIFMIDTILTRAGRMIGLHYF